MQTDDPSARALNEQLQAIGDLLSKHQDISEIMVNEDGVVWVEQAGLKHRTTQVYTPDERTAIIRLLAGMQSRLLSDEKPSLGTRIPLWGGARWQSLMPPVVEAPIFCIRIPPRTSLSLADLEKRGAITEVQRTQLETAVSERRNIVVCGGTGTGKTTILKALLKNVRTDRLVVIEDNPEIVVVSPNTTKILTNLNYKMADAIFDTLRLSPDRIIIGEIRTGYVAWEWCVAAANTGHVGSMATIHASSADKIFKRFENLIKTEFKGEPDGETIREAVEVAVFIEKVEQVVNKDTIRVIRKVTQILDNREQQRRKGA